jgi:hypothetical protein
MRLVVDSSNARRGLKANCLGSFVQVNLWLLRKFSQGDYSHAFYFTEVLVWLGYVLAALTAAWGLACAR